MRSDQDPGRRCSPRALQPGPGAWPSAADCSGRSRRLVDERDLRRMHVGRYRGMYAITETTVTLVVIRIGCHG
ncbi:type II toxin-antitoxin system RelE/ParE family toxin [Streptomyces goshikiensis]|uniref:type II toxin-antitoxin system RelE/ParE family toxin n=1 Tax=Streptomyces goshikiensis TaxID=1942 RepID=UPI0037D1CFDE